MHPHFDHTKYHNKKKNMPRFYWRMEYKVQLHCCCRERWAD